MIQFLAQTGQREVTHFIILSRINTSRLHAGQMLKLSSQKQATNVVMLAFESLEEGVHRCCADGLIPIRDRDALLKEIAQRNLDSNVPSEQAGNVEVIDLWRVRRVVEGASVNVKLLAGELTITVEGEEHKDERMLAIEDAALKIADEQELWQRREVETLDSGITRKSIKKLQDSIPFP
jgi:hypothetical protein